MTINECIEWDGPILFIQKGEQAGWIKQVSCSCCRYLIPFIFRTRIIDKIYSYRNSQKSNCWRVKSSLQLIESTFCRFKNQGKTFNINIDFLSWLCSKFPTSNVDTKETWSHSVLQTHYEAYNHLYTILCCQFDTLLCRASNYIRIHKAFSSHNANSVLQRNPHGSLDSSCREIKATFFVIECSMSVNHSDDFQSIYFLSLLC